MKSKPNPKSDTGGATLGSAPQTMPEGMFKRNLQAFIEYARAQGAIVKEGDVWSEVWLEGSPLSLHVRKDLAEYLEKEGLGDDEPIDPQRFWQHLVFRYNCEDFTRYINLRHAFWRSSLNSEDQKILSAAPQYLSQYSQAARKLLTEEEMQALWEDLLQAVLGVSKPQIPEYMFKRNLEAFFAYARARGAEVNDDGSVAFKGVILTGIRQALSELGADRDPVDTEEVWNRIMFKRNLQAFTEYVKQKGAVIGDDGKLVIKGVTLTDNIEREVEDAGGKEEPIDPQDLWDRLLFRCDFPVWLEYKEAKSDRGRT